MSRVMAMVLLTSLQAAAIELKWRKEAVEHYRYEETVHWKGEPILTVHGQLALTLRANGTAEVRLEALDASLGTRSFTLLPLVPRHERVVVADAKDHFAESWRIVLRDGRPTVERRAKSAIDVVPRRLLALLALPEGPLERGHVVPVKNGRQTLLWRLASVDGARATLFVSDSVPAGRPGTQSLKPEAADLVVRFDTAEGRLLEVRGIVIWTDSTRAVSRVLMQRLPRKNEKVERASNQ
jgi:hypothetical protein